jgi:protein SCO1/2/putative membrane protein
MNGLCCLCLCTGLWLVRRGRRRAHALAMGAATVFGAAFLAGYLTYHFFVQPELGPTRFHGTGLARPAYFALLGSHVVLAAANVPLVVVTLFRAWREDWGRHRRIARVTWPVWLYVSVTGVLVYFVLYHWNPAPPG